jgi:hypothetical protein
MAIYLEFIDFVVPISTIQKKYRGGWEQCLRDHARLIGGRVWYDEYLFRDGAMNRHDIKLIVDRWTEIGFEPKEFRDGKQVWKDVCVVESLLGGPTLLCDWLVFDSNQRIAYLKGTKPDVIVGRKDIPRSGEKQ